MHCEASTREWLMPLGNGGYGAGDLSLTNSRSYHGLLIAALGAPLGRRTLLKSVQVFFTSIAGLRFSLGGMTTEGVTPAVCCFQQSSPHMEWVFLAEKDRIRLKIEPFGEKNAIQMTWSCEGGEGGEIELQPILSARSHHGGNEKETLGLTASAHDAIWRPVGVPLAVHLWTSGVVTVGARKSFTVHLHREAMRGLRGDETLSGQITIRDRINCKRSCRLAVSDAPAEKREPRIESLQSTAERVPSDDREVLRRAVMASVITHPDDGKQGVLAGYHWFGEWGRDTMIALPGIGVASGDWDLVGEILEQWANRLSMGMLPNQLENDGNGVSHNSADSSLWFADAVRVWFDATGDRSHLERCFLPALLEICDAYTSGTRFGIRVDPNDGLLTAGMEGVQLTWMDAKVGGEVMTPRRGKCVELNALFHSACRFLGEQLREVDGGIERSNEILHRAERLARSFQQSFWNETEGSLEDCIGADRTSFELRPNQLMALRMGDALLDGDLARRALRRVEDELLTPFGLRTLAPSHPDYRGVCCGDPHARDSAYHQGTVWPWLLGPLADAQRALRGRTNLDLKPLLASLEEGTVGHLAEIFDGDAPHHARGAVAQAWSASEVYRILSR